MGEMLEPDDVRDFWNLAEVYRKRQPAALALGGLVCWEYNMKGAGLLQNVTSVCAIYCSRGEAIGVE